MQTTVAGTTIRRITIGAVLIAIAIAAFYVAARIPHTIAIFLIAAFIAFGVQPIVIWLEQHRLPKPLAIAVVFLLLLAIIAVGLTVVIPLTLSQVQTLVTNVPALIATVQQWLTGAELDLQQRIPGIQIPANSFDIGQLGTQRLSSLATGTIVSLGGIVLGTATAFFIAFSAIVLSFFFLLSDSQISETFASMFPVSRRATARKLASEVTNTFGSYISGQVIVSAITGIVVAVGSALVGFKFSLILGIITAVAYAIPMIGMLIAQGIAIVLCAPQGGWVVLWVQVIMFGMARVSDMVLVPKIMGESVGVSPIGVMFAVFAGGELFGIPGLLLGIPVAALVKILWRYFVAPWLHAQLDNR
jgi:predicted PurR-regulated permease PerM